jgi:hypothetical protein
MMAIEREAAEQELQRILDFFEYQIDPDNTDRAQTLERLVTAIERGRIILDEESGSITMSLVRPIQMENGQVLAELTFREPTANDLRVLDKYKETEAMARTIHLTSKMSGQPIGVIERLGARDLSVLGAVTAVFT